MFERNQTDDRPPLEKTFSLPLDETAIKVRGECQLNEIVREYRERFGTAD